MKSQSIKIKIKRNNKNKDIEILGCAENFLKCNGFQEVFAFQSGICWRKFLDDQTTTDVSQLFGYFSSMNSKEWLEISFYCCERGALVPFRHLIQSKKVPILARNRNGDSFLHTAVASNKPQIVEFLLHMLNDNDQIRKLFCAVSSDGFSPLELAIQCNLNSCISLLLGVGFHDEWAENDLMALLKKCTSICQPHLSSRIKGIIRNAQLKSLLLKKRYGLPIMECDQDLQVLKQKVIAFEWWDQRANHQWDINDMSVLYTLLDEFVKNGDVDILEWFLSEWNIPVRPPRILSERLTVADKASIGHIPFHKINPIFQSVEIDAELYLNPLIAMLGCGPRSFGQKYQIDSIIYEKWNGNCMDLMDLLEPFFNKYGEKATNEFYGECFSRLKLPDRCERKGRRSNVYFECLVEANSEKRLEVIKVLSSRFEIDGYHCIPRPDILVKTGQLSILKWMCSSDLISISAPLSTPTMPSFDIDKEENNANIQEDICAICLEGKWNPHTLSCNHSFCELCLRRLCANDASRFEVHLAEFQCPLCRVSVALPLSISAPERVAIAVRQEDPWLCIGARSTVADVLLGLAAGYGAVLVLDWLISDQGIHPGQAIFVDGRNIMHLAVLHGHVAVCKYLCKNFPDLSSVRDAQNQTPIDYVFETASHSAGLLVALFQSMDVACNEFWIQGILQSKNAGVMQLKPSAMADQSVLQLSDLLAKGPFSVDSALFKKFVELMDKVSVVDNCDMLRARLKRVVDILYLSERYDLLQWTLGNKSLIWEQVFEEKNEEFNWSGMCRTAAKTLSSSASLSSFLRELVDFAQLTSSIQNCLISFKMCVMEGGPVQQLEHLIDRQNQLFATAPSCYQETLTVLMKINLKNVVDKSKLNHKRATFNFAKDLDVLQYAFARNHIHILKWALSKHENILISTQAVYDAVRISNATSIESLAFLFSWMKDRSISILTSYKPYLKKSETILETFAFMHGHYIVLGDKDGAVQHYKLIEFLCNCPDIQYAIEHGDCSDILLIYVKAQAVEDGGEDWKSEALLKTFKLLVRAGANINCLDEHSASLIEAMVGKGEVMFLSVIRWLALEKNLNIQFLEFGGQINPIIKATSKRKGLLSHEGKIAFEKIQQEQNKKAKNQEIYYS